MSGICPMIDSEAAVYCNVFRQVNDFLSSLGYIGSVLMLSLVGTSADNFGFETRMAAALILIILLRVFAIVNAAYGKLGKHAAQ